MTTARADVVAEAMSWLNTPYKHHGAVKGVGVDCAQLLNEVYANVGLTTRLELGYYATQWHLNSEVELFLHWLEVAGGHRIYTPPQAGDVGVWKYGNTHAHGGIVVDPGDDPLILHSHIKARRGVILSRPSEFPLSAAEGNQYWSIFP